MAQTSKYRGSTGTAPTGYNAVVAGIHDGTTGCVALCAPSRSTVWCGLSLEDFIDDVLSLLVDSSRITFTHCSTSAQLKILTRKISSQLARGPAVSRPGRAGAADRGAVYLYAVPVGAPHSA